jgi:hypothetical protein
MKKFLPIIVVTAVLAAAGYFLLLSDSGNSTAKAAEKIVLSDFDKKRPCGILPPFIYKMGVKRPVIDLSQMEYKGVLFRYGPQLKRVIHKKSWERFDALGTYSIDKSGDIYLTPNPFISITPATFNLQKAIYKMDGKSGELQRWMVFDDIAPSSNNPYGMISVLYDCEDGTLWASAIDKSDYKGSKGRIYHIDPAKKEVIGRIENFDALTLAWLYSKNGRYLLMGSALDNGVYAVAFKDGKVAGKPVKLFELPNPKMHVRKIRVVAKNTLYLEAIKFSYSLIAETNKKQRAHYRAKYDSKTQKWSVEELKE